MNFNSSLISTFDIAKVDTSVNVCNPLKKGKNNRLSQCVGTFRSVDTKKTVDFLNFKDYLLPLPNT